MDHDSNQANNFNSNKKDIYITDPPLEKQVQSIKQLFNNLNDMINEDIQSSNVNDNDSNDDFTRQNKKETKKFNGSTVKSIGSELKGSIHKLFVDIIKSLRHAQKHNQGDRIENMKSYLLDQFNDLKFNLQSLRAEMTNLLQDTIQRKQKKLSDSLVFDYEHLMEEIMSQFCEDLYDIYLKMIRYSDSDFSSSIFNSLFEGIYDFTKDLSDYHLKLVQLADCILKPANETANFIKECQEFKEKPQDNELAKVLYKKKVDKLKEFFISQINAMINDFKQAITSIENFNKRIHEFTLSFYEQLATAKVNFELFDPPKVYEPRCTGFNDICNFFCLSSPESMKSDELGSDEESENEENNNETLDNPNIEEIWESLRHEKFIIFARSDITKTGNTLQADLFEVWRSMALSDQVSSVGSLLYTLLDTKFKYHDSGLLLSDVSDAYRFAVMYNNDLGGDDVEGGLTADLQSLLEGVIDRAGSSLLALRNKQIQFLSSPPQKSEQRSYIKQAKHLAREIQTRALDLNTALFNGREADFAISQRRLIDISDDKTEASSVTPKQNPNNSQKIEEEEGDDNDNDNDDDYSSDEDQFRQQQQQRNRQQNKQQNQQEENEDQEEEEDFIDFADNFQLYENEESEEIVKQLDKIVALSNSVFSNAKNRTNSDFNNRKRITQTTPKNGQPEKQLMTKSMKMSIQRDMEDEILTQATCIEDAMVSTYTQLLASIKGTLVALIRTSNITEALAVKNELNERVLELIGHLESIKKRAKVRNDVQTIKETDNRLSNLKGSEEDSLKSCICESLRNVIEIAIANYGQNIKLIDSNLDMKIRKKKKKLMRRAKRIKIDKHIPDLILIEKKKRIETRKEMQRKDFNNYEKEESAIDGYIEKKKYALARREKKKLAENKVEAQKQRINDLEEKYDKMKKEKLEEQKNELIRMENRFTKRSEEERRKANKLKEDLKLTLVTSIRTLSLHHYQFALKIVRVDQKTKREIQRMLNKVVNESIEQKSQDQQNKNNVDNNKNEKNEQKNKVHNVATILGEQGKKTNWLQ